ERGQGLDACAPLPRSTLLFSEQLSGRRAGETRRRHRRNCRQARCRSQGLADIGGRVHSGGRRMSRLVNVRNPRTGALEPVRMSDAADVAAVCERVRAAQPRWSELGLTGRIRALQQWADAVDKAADRIAEALAIDTGRWTISR